MSDMRKYKNLYRQPKIVPFSRYLNLADGDWPDLRPLLPIRRRLEGLLLNCRVHDISLVGEFTSLRDLGISEFVTGGFDLSRLTVLTELFLDVSRERLIVPAGDALQALGLVRCDSLWAEWISSVGSMRGLRLIRPRVFPAMLPGSVRDLEVSTAKLRSSLGWDGATVDKLSVIDVRGIQDLSAFCSLTIMKELYIEDCNELESLDGVEISPGAIVRLVGRNRLK
ncbi:MAG: hypothetical protein R2722_01520 [Tessaracoccus sp.]